MTSMSAAVALAARAYPHSSAGEDGRDRLRAAAAVLGEARPEILAGPSSVDPDGTLVLVLASPQAILPAVLSIAETLRPVKATFSAAVVPRSPAGETLRREPSVETTVLAAEHAATGAVAGLAETDLREYRVLVTGAGCDPLIGTVLSLILELYDAMTDRQRQVVALVRESGSQQEVAKHLGVTRQAVNQSLSAAHWHHLRHAEEVVLSRLASLVEP